MEIAPIIALDEVYHRNKDLEAIQQSQRLADLIWFSNWLFMNTEIFVRKDGIKHRQLPIEKYDELMAEITKGK